MYIGLCSGAPLILWNNVLDTETDGGDTGKVEGQETEDDNKSGKEEEKKN